MMCSGMLIATGSEDTSIKVSMDMFYTLLLNCMSSLLLLLRILFWRKLQASSHVLLQLLASLTINEHIAVCSQYGMSAVSVSRDSVKCSVWSKFERLCCLILICSFILLVFYISVSYLCLCCFVRIQ